MITKAIIQSINADGTRCVVRMPLFESSANSAHIEAEALVNITPGVFNNLAVGDVVFVGFEENALEKPIILGKLFRGANVEGSVRGGGAIFNSLKVNSDVTLPASTVIAFQDNLKNNYANFTTLKQTVDYIKWLEKLMVSNISSVEDNFNCFKNWTQWQLKAENVEIDDGDLDANQPLASAFMYQNEGDTCKICGADCHKDSCRKYKALTIKNTYPKI